MIELAIGLGVGFAVGIFRAPIWAGVKKLFGKAEADIAKKIGGK